MHCKWWQFSRPGCTVNRKQQQLPHSFLFLDDYEKSLQSSEKVVQRRELPAMMTLLLSKPWPPSLLLQLQFAHFVILGIYFVTVDELPIQIVIGAYRLFKNRKRKVCTEIRFLCTRLTNAVNALYNYCTRLMQLHK